MKKKNVKNPLRKRIFRELRSDFSKYLVVSLFLILTIGFVSGMYVANGSMMQAADESVSKYKLEDGHFELKEQADEALLYAVQSGNRADVEQYYLDKAKAELACEEAYETACEEAWEKVLEEVRREYADAAEKYELDDPDFKAVPVKIYENFYINEEEDYNNDGTADGTIRIYAKTDEVNQACLMDGRFPENADEIAIDRMHADNIGIETGDTITVGEQEFQVVGLIAYVNYSTLHEKSTDMMFDALKFDVAMVTESGFARLDNTIHYAYAWHYKETPETETDEKHASDDFMKALVTQIAVNENELEDYIPRYANPAINFAAEDMGSDEAMGGVLLDILIVIIAFIFAVTISNTIAKEASAIGTLRALGYTRGELVRHYLSMPVIVTFVAAGVGNALGYTVFKKVVVSMYYNSYSLPAYETIWNPDAFLKTTLIPAALMFVVNLVVIIRVMQHTPLQFLRRDLKKTKRKKAMRLPKWGFLNRFRLRIIFQNISNYLILAAGIFFIMVMLAMAVGMPSTLQFYKENAADMMFAKYQYVLTDWEDEDGNDIETKNETAEKFSMCSLQKESGEMTEEVSVYGISDDSSYVKIENLAYLKENEIYISKSFSDKYGLKAGDCVYLDEKYENRQYQFTVAGIYDRCQNIAAFLPIENYRLVFGLDGEEFTGYLSETEITDIKEENIATVLSERDITKICDQLDHSMGSYMTYFQILCILLSAVLIYLLTKIIIEKNENAISMIKILGYENRQIASLYLFSTTMVLIVCDAGSVILGAFVMKQVWKAIMFEYSGWYAFTMEPMGYVKMFAFVLIGYLIVVFFDFNRIKKIPMDEALKNVE